MATCALVLERGLYQRHQLVLVAGKAARDEGGAQLQRKADEVSAKLEQERQEIAGRKEELESGLAKIKQQHGPEAVIWSSTEGFQ
jgi:hypothetical protein